MSLPRAQRKELILEGISFEKSLKSRGLGYDFLIDHFDQIIEDGFLINPNSYNFKNIDEFNLSFSRSSFSPGRAFMKVAEKLNRKAELEKNYRFESSVIYKRSHTYSLLLLHHLLFESSVIYNSSHTMLMVLS